MLSHGITADGPMPVFKGGYVTHRRMCGAEDDRRRRATPPMERDRKGAVGGVIDEAPPVTVSLHLYKLS